MTWILINHLNILSNYYDLSKHDKNDKYLTDVNLRAFTKKDRNSKYLKML